MNRLEDESERAIAPSGLSPAAIKRCCTALYESEGARLILGDSFHPGGSELTERLGRMLNLRPQSRVLDVAAGRGASAMTLATRFGCEVVGIDLSRRNVEAAEREAHARRLSDKVAFQSGDAERLPFADASFDAVVCECALCTFPNKPAAAAEFARVLRVGGGVGVSDLTREGPSPPELDGLVSWVACVGDAQPLGEYSALLAAAGLKILAAEEHNDALIDFVNRIRARVLAAEIMIGLNKLALPEFDAGAVKDFARDALSAIRAGQIGYAIVTAAKAG
jgi:arsenite methyltransferase